LLSYWLALKSNYGFYEVNSMVYNTLTFAGLLNLLDFVDPLKEVELHAQAHYVATKLLQSLSSAALER
jgi:hypothetical protein